MSNRRYLKVPYSDKEKIKALGGQWDSLVKLWYVPMHVPLDLVKQWIIKSK